MSIDEAMAQLTFTTLQNASIVIGIITLLAQESRITHGTRTARRHCEKKTSFSAYFFASDQAVGLQKPPAKFFYLFIST
ncbi:unnamed protein product [Ixodes persulcatus]